MKKFVFLALTFFLIGAAYDSYGQLNRRSIKKNNRRISSFKGRKATFSKEKRYNALGFSLNALNYYGDLAPAPKRFSTDISFTRPAIGFSLSHRFGPRYTLTGSFMYGTLRGSDNESADPGDLSNGIFRYNRNLSFRNRIKELSVVATFDLYPNMATYISRVKWTPYAFAGIAVFHHNPQAQVPRYHVDGVTEFSNAGEWVNLHELGTEGQNATLDPGDANAGIKSYKLIQPAIPFGVGVRFRLNEVVDIAGEFQFRYVFTDYLDDVSRNYVDLGVFGDNELAKALSYRSGELAKFNPADPTIQATVLQTYVGRDGQTYFVAPGYGREYNRDGDTNLRGDNGNNNDTFTVFTVRVTYIFGKTFHRAKFR